MFSANICCSNISYRLWKPSFLTLQVRVNNHGDPVVFSENTTFALLPSMTSVTPNNGSLNGGTVVNITGAGFVGMWFIWYVSKN